MSLPRFSALAVALAPAIGLAAAVPAPAAAQERQAAERAALEESAAGVVAVMRGERSADTVFAPDFLAQISAEQLRDVTEQLVSQFGDVVALESVKPVDATRATAVVRFERATGSGPIAIAATGEGVIGFALRNFEPLDDSAEKIVADLAAMSGTTAALFAPLDGGPAVLSHNADMQMPIGSAFKLYALAATQRAVNEGRLPWDQVLRLDRRSLPSGVMQEWPEGAAVTLETAATLMISISGNTATDLVIETVGREAIEELIRETGHSDPDRMLPYLTTREMFTLKGGDLGVRYAAADEAGQRALLPQIDAADLDTDGLMMRFGGDEPMMIEDLEWFASMEDMRALLRVLSGDGFGRARAIMKISAAVPAEVRAEWSYLGYKGGSEPGVLNLTWLLQDEAGAWHILSVNGADPEAALDDSALQAIALRIFALAE